MDLKKLWIRTCRALGADATQRQVGAMWNSLVHRYGEAHRAYHTLDHLREIFTLLDELGMAPEADPVLYFALWYHDAIYDTQPHEPGVPGNEAKSLVLARSAATRAMHIKEPSGLEGLIMATLHNASPTDPREQLLVDVDLAILGATPERYRQYMAQVRKEYGWVPEAIYRAERAKIMRAFLERSRNGGIFQHPRLRELREVQARENIAYELAILESTP